MKRVKTKQLKLNSRTIRTLNDDQLRTVVGGMQDEPMTSGPTCPTSGAAGSGGCGGGAGGVPDPK